LAVRSRLETLHRPKKTHRLSATPPSSERAVLEVTLGQRALPSVHGEQTTATAYAGLGSRHLLVAADGAAGPIPTRLAAQVATASAVARFRASVFPNTEEQLVEAFAEAQQAVRRGALGTHAEGRAGAAMVAVVVEPSGVTAARVGGGRVHVLTDGVLRSLFRDDGYGHVGDGSTAAEIATYAEPLPAGGRVILITESVARAVAADLDQLASGPAPQLAAARVADAARRRGQYEPVAVQVCEIQDTPARFGPHPAFARIDREQSRTLSADGRWIGPSDSARARPHQRRAETGWLLWFFIAALLGAGAALVVNGASDTYEPTPRPVVAAPDVREGDVTPARSAVSTSDVVEIDVADVAPALSAELETEIAALFDHGAPTRTARALRGYITRRWPKDGEVVFEDLERWILAHGDPEVVAALLELMKDRDLKRTSKWLAELIPRLYARDGGDEDAPDAQ